MYHLADTSILEIFVVLYLYYRFIGRFIITIPEIADICQVSLSIYYC